MKVVWKDFYIELFLLSGSLLFFRSSVLEKYQCNMLQELLALEKDVSLLEKAEDNAMVRLIVYGLNIYVKLKYLDLILKYIAEHIEF
jgi:hypothetical protein